MNRLSRWQYLRYVAWFLAGVSGANLIGLLIAPTWQLTWGIRIIASVAIASAWGRSNGESLLELPQETRITITAIALSVQLGLLLAAWG
ncbi:hypothetical protein [Halotia branconii]|uniref:Uncharacterized protein n=1 Tax=Halotia branconii CENA392 TaxID=1539056 RepID=A0AAJ6NNC7_9CYAN|nr:hypothetical protein [Halotia branconii]WGV23695.1 hypothetical protein QI031_17980 [Halotia branconii CENA392]